MNSTWVVCADASRARIFNYNKHDHSLEELLAFSHPASRLKESDLGDDEPGVVLTRSDYVLHGMAEPKQRKELEAMSFAKDIAQHLSKEHKLGHFSRLVLIAAPEFLGMLRNKLSKTLTSSNIFELNKDVSKLPASQILEHLPRYF